MPKLQKKPDGIELRFDKYGVDLRFILAGERHNWTLHRGQKTKDGSGWGWHGDNSYFGSLEHAMNELKDEIPRRSKWESVEELLECAKDTREYLAGIFSGNGVESKRRVSYPRYPLR